MKFIDLFAGIGGFRYGLEKSNTNRKETLSKNSLQSERNKPNSQGGTRGCGSYSCVWSNEWDKYASQIYKKHYGECDTRDIRTVEASEIPDHDLLTAGFPCQAFSVAGKRLGFEDTRGTLFFEIARILKHKRPRLVLLENVKGLLSHEQGKTFQTILGVLSDIGYRVEWQVLNSKNFGVPQNRERVFIVGYSGKGSKPKVFPIEESSGKTLKEYTKEMSQSYRVYDTRGLSTTLAGRAGGVGAKTGLYAIKEQKDKFRFHRNDKKKSGIQGKDVFKPSAKTMDIIDNHPKNILQGSRIRRLTPTECERLQGFPDGWTEGISDTQRYKCLGNAISTPVITAIGKKL